MVVAHPEVKAALATKGQTPMEELGECRLLGRLQAPILALVGRWFLMPCTIAPVGTLTQAVEQVEAGTIHQRLARTGNRDELDRLPVVFNDMMGRLDDS